MYFHKCFSHGIAFRNFALSSLVCFIALLWFASAAVAAADIELESVITGLHRPVAITHAGDGSDRPFITLLGGQIVIYDGRQVMNQPFLDIRALVTSGENYDWRLMEGSNCYNPAVS